jgi:hypothetical protein
VKSVASLFFVYLIILLTASGRTSLIFGEQAFQHAGE